MGIQGSLPLIAKALGRKYGLNVVIASSVQVPHTTGKTIYLPALPAGDPKKTSVMLNGFIDHEAAHVRFSDFESLKPLTKLERIFANVLEDPRIERRMTEQYPGCRYNLDALYEAISGDMPRLDACQDTLTLITHGILSKLMLEVNQRKGVTEDPWLMTEALLGNDLAKAILDIALPVGFSNDPKSSADGAKAIVELLKQANQVQEQPEDDSDSGQDGDFDGDGAGVRAGNQPSSGGNGKTRISGQGAQNASQPGFGQNPASGKASGATQPGGGSGAVQTQSGDGSKAESDAGNQAGQAGSGGREASLEGTHTGYEAIDTILNCSDDEIDAVMDDLGAGNIAARKLEEICEQSQQTFSDEEVLPAPWRSSPNAVSMLGIENLTKALRYRLEDVLQHRQEEGYYTRVTGTRLLRRRVGLYESGIRKVFKFKEDHEAMNTAIYVTCDISGSMNGKSLDQAKIATICIGDTLNGFEGLNYHVSSFDTRVFTYPESWLKARQQIAATPAQGGTLFTPALIYGLDWLAQAEQERKLLVLITDGEPGDQENADFLLRNAEKDGVELYALAIAGSISPALRALYGSRVGLVRDVKQLPHLLGDLIEQNV